MPSNFSNIATLKHLALIALLSMSFTVQAEDPIDRSIIFIAANFGFMNFDADRQFKDRDFGGVSLGLHLNRTWSTSLFYSRSHPESSLGRNFRFENYFVQVKHYWREHERLRPYITGGLGETILDREQSSSDTTAHAGVGLHYAINEKWAGQMDVRFFNSLSEGLKEESLMGSIVYRFGKGER